MSNENIISWDDSDTSSKLKAMEQFSESVDAYEGVLSKSTANYNYMSFLDIEPNRSVRMGFTGSDYYAFRPEERIPKKQKNIIKMCMSAYDKVGIVRNVIDLMGDFGSQGISIVHENKSVETFYQQWFKKIDGKERSERFLNNLYRTGNVILYKSYAKITPEIEKYIKAIGSDIKIEVPTFEDSVIPWRYNFFNPLTVEQKNGSLNLFLGVKNFEITANSFIDNFKDGAIPSNILDTLPPDLKTKIKNGDKTIPLNPDRIHVSYYKKDDWNFWANPMTYAILDDIIMLEKMRLADLSALDGAISNIRLWTLGNFEHKILPTKTGINKLRNILASNVGGGTMELVWGPELTYTESNSQVYKFLGSEKYQSVLNSIYAGLGVPPTLTGMATNGGGFTNNFISLKTLVERLQYGRDQLIKFWEGEIEFIRRSMGFRKPAHIIFDQMSLSDESSEKNLLIQLADRDIISHETILERFKEVPDVEKMRLKREFSDRQDDSNPDKAGPFHNANHKQEMEKIEKNAQVNQKLQNVKTKKFSNPNGRPLFKRDKSQRKKRVENPKSKPGVAELFVWCQDSYDSISETLNKAFLGSLNKSNLRQLTKLQACQLEDIKLDVLTNIEPMKQFNVDCVNKVIASNLKAPISLKNYLKNNKINIVNMTVEDYKKRVIASYVEFLNTEFS
jgi:hypothetical protein